MRRNSRRNHNRKERRGVGGVIAGVMLMAILLSTVLVYFVLILNNDRARASYEIQSRDIAQEKGAETLTVVRDELLDCDPAPCMITLFTNNEGALPLVITNILLYCIDPDPSCPPIPVPAGTDNNDPIEQLPGGTPLTLNAQDGNTRLVGPVNDTLTYRIDVITERGNVVSAVECLVDAVAQICIDTGGSTGPDFEITAFPATFTMTPGSSQRSEIRVYSVLGFSAPVDITVTTPPDITATPSPQTITPPNPGSAAYNLTITTSPALGEGTYPLTVTGTSGALTHTVQITVSTFSISGAVTEGIIQGTGSIQLDFRSFGAIYPQLGTRDGVVQSGWDSRVASRYSYATGYPGFQLMTISTQGGQSSTQVAFVEVARNLDNSGQALTLTRHTGINPAAGQVQGTPPKLNYICKGDPLANAFTAYDEDNPAANKVLPALPITTPMNAGWEEIYFCNINPGQANPANYWTASFPFANLNPIFLIARGDFENGAPYGQTIPYQAISVGKYTSILNSCLLAADTSTACPAHGTNQGVTGTFTYFETEANLQAGVTVWLHLDVGPTFTDGIDVKWLEPDGTYNDLIINAPASTINGNRNIQVTLPSVTCSTPGTDENHTISFNDGRDASGDRYIYYMTFMVDC